MKAFCIWKIKCEIWLDSCCHFSSHFWRFKFSS